MEGKRKGKKKASPVIKVDITSRDVPSHYVKCVPAMGYGQMGLKAQDFREYPGFFSFKKKKNH